MFQWLPLRLIETDVSVHLDGKIIFFKNQMLPYSVPSHQSYQIISDIKFGRHIERQLSQFALQ